MHSRNWNKKKVSYLECRVEGRECQGMNLERLGPDYRVYNVCWVSWKAIKADDDINQNQKQQLDMNKEYSKSVCCYENQGKKLYLKKFSNKCGKTVSKVTTKKW